MDTQCNGGRSEQSLETLVERALEHLKQLRYSAKGVSNYQGTWNSFIRFVRQSGSADGFSAEAVERYLTSRGIPALGSERLSNSQRHVRMAMRILTELAFHGYFQRRRKTGAESPLPAHWKGLFEGFERFCREERRTSPRCLQIRQRDLRRFLDFLETRDVRTPREIDAAALSGFVGLLTHLRPKTIAATVSNLRSFLRYLCLQGMIDGTLVEQVPKVRVYQGERLPTIWTPQDLQALLTAVDRASPIGKRDYAILLLAARLGLRAGDIRALRIDQLDWEHACIHVVQAKTGTPLDLPLTEEVGLALIDYLRNGRPAATHREVFLRHNAPFEPFGRDNNLYWIISTYRRKAGIELPRESRRGLHSLRHTLASRLMEAGVPIDSIAGAMGHLSPDTTRLYLQMDVNALRRAALDPEEESNE